MIELYAILQCYAAMALFRAAEPERFALETGVVPKRLGVEPRAWRRMLRGSGVLFLVTACAVAVTTAGVVVGGVVVSAAAMASTVALVLLAPIARRLAWGLAALTIAVAPVSTVLTLLAGGSGAS